MAEVRTMVSSARRNSRHFSKRGQYVHARSAKKNCTVLGLIRKASVLQKATKASMRSASSMRSSRMEEQRRGRAHVLHENTERLEQLYLRSTGVDAVRELHAGSQGVSLAENVEVHIFPGLIRSLTLHLSKHEELAETAQHFHAFCVADGAIGPSGRLANSRAELLKRRERQIPLRRAEQERHADRLGAYKPRSQAKSSESAMARIPGRNKRCQRSSKKQILRRILH
eukprot:scaffold8283_cov258-Pinguiococcus_pyrenoidosus.AAC.3